MSVNWLRGTRNGEDEVKKMEEGRRIEESEEQGDEQERAEKGAVNLLEFWSRPQTVSVRQRQGSLDIAKRRDEQQREHQ